ncbi:MAG: acyl-CoA dehydrogenase family protein [Planctomycetota bacterium]
MTALETPAHSQPVAAPGGGFLVAPVPRAGVFTREQVSEDQQEFADAARRFTEGEVLPRVEEIERGVKDESPVVLDLLRQAAELGLASIELPEAYGGLGLGLTTSMLCSEALYACASFAATLGAHAGIGTLPIAYFGNEAQRQAYLPQLATAEKISCYLLTEPGNGSDALHGRTTAALSADGTHFVLNGQKQFITNGSWADMGVVFANIDGKYSALIVDLRAPGVSRGAEEKKMGIRGSSTCGLVFQDVRVPAENLLGKVGDAAKIALNILYVGRMKLGFATLGTTKYAIDKTLEFCSSRKQFGRPVIEFDLQQGKLAEMCAWTYGTDAACYRIVGEVDALIAQLPAGHTPLDEIAILRRFGLECALIKVSGSETLSRVLYHALRMHGGYGFCEEYQIERLARDNVVETIYEGTNDINRLVAGGALVENAFLGAIPFREGLAEIHASLRAGALEPAATGDLLAGEEVRLTRLKRGLAFACERVLLATGKDIKKEQQVTVSLVDSLMQLYVAESAFARTVQAGACPLARVRQDLTRLLLLEAEREVPARCRDALSGVGDEGARADLERLLGAPAPTCDGLSVAALRRRAAEHFILTGRYDL